MNEEDLRSVLNTMTTEQKRELFRILRSLLESL